MMDQWSYRHVHPLISPSCVYMWLSWLKLFPVIWSTQLTGLSINSRECRPDLTGFFFNNASQINSSSQSLVHCFVQMISCALTTVITFRLCDLLTAFTLWSSSDPGLWYQMSISTPLWCIRVAKNNSKTGRWTTVVTCFPQLILS